MNFFEWQTFFDESKEEMPKRATLLDHVKYEQEKIATCSLSNRIKFMKLRRLLIEYSWQSQGKPYYKIGNKIASAMCRTKLNHIPINMFEVPAGFDAVHIRLAKQHEELTIDENLWVRSVLMGYAPEIGENVIVANNRIYFNRGTITFLIDLGQRQGKYFLCSMLNLFLGSDSSIEEAIQQSLKLEQEPEKVRKIGEEKILSVFLNAIKLLVTCKFIADVPEQELIEFDVLSRYKDEFKRASNTRQQELIEKSKRKGKIGWNIGTSELLFGPGPEADHSESEQTGRELEHAHIRSPHLHIVRYGQGKKDIKVKFYRATVVRPDLPFKD